MLYGSSRDSRISNSVNHPTHVLLVVLSEVAMVGGITNVAPSVDLESR